MPSILATLFNLVFITVAVRLLILLQTVFKRRESRKRETRKSLPIKTLVVLGSGGHTTEILQLLKNVDPTVYNPLLYVIASTDDTSERRFRAFGGRAPDAVYHIPRSREVGQSYVTSVGTTIWAFVFSLQVVFKVQPDLLLCNGPGTCLPIAVATFLFRILGLCEGNVVFVESFCRVESLSLTGKLLYPFADMFVVHWDELHKKHPRSITASSFVPNKGGRRT